MPGEWAGWLKFDGPRGAPSGSGGPFCGATASLDKRGRSVDVCGGQWETGDDSATDVGSGSAVAVAYSDANVGGGDSEGNLEAAGRRRLLASPGSVL